MEKYLRLPKKTMARMFRWSRPRVASAKLDTLEDKLRALVELPTVTNDFATMHSALHMVANFLQRRGLHIARHTYDGFECLVATTRSTKTPTVYLYAHLDVVPASPELFTLRIEDDKYIGRGVYDMKGSLAAYMQLVDDLQGSLDQYDFGILVTTDEEFGGRAKASDMSGFGQLLQEGYLGKVYIMPDGGRDWQLESSAKGFTRYVLTATGVSGHGSRPWLGDNAIHKVMDALSDLREHFKEQGPDTDTINISVIHAGEVVNRIPDKATAEIDIRSNDKGSYKRLTSLLETVCKKHGVSYRIQTSSPLVYNDLKDPYLVSFAKSIKNVVGVQVGGVKSLGGSDARFLMQYKLPAAVFYPFGGGHHSNHEWLQVGELEHMRDVFRDYLEREARG